MLAGREGHIFRPSALRPAAKAMLIRLPIPPKELAPNSRTHWRVKAKYVKAYREEARIAGRDLRFFRPDLPWPLPLGVLAEPVFVFPTNRRRDTDNLGASLKAAWDGLVDAGVLADDSARHLTIAAVKCVVQKEARQGYVLISLRLRPMKTNTQKAR